MLSLSLSPVNRAEVLRYMGCQGTPETLTSLIDDCERKLLAEAFPKICYRILPLVRKEQLLFCGELPLPGADIAQHLALCDRAVVMAATLSAQADQLIQRESVRDMTRGFAMDALASAAIEQICDKGESVLRQLLPDDSFTWRFSPGYGDFPLSLQPQLLDLLAAQKQIGLTVTENWILIPRKSVTAIIGLSKQPLPQKVRGCAVCQMRDRCQFRKNGSTCHDGGL